jgi:hypothetical protein
MGMVLNPAIINRDFNAVYFNLAKKATKNEWYNGHTVNPMIMFQWHLMAMMFNG